MLKRESASLEVINPDSIPSDGSILAGTRREFSPARVLDGARASDPSSSSELTKSADLVVAACEAGPALVQPPLPV